MTLSCLSCKAVWSEGAFGADCEECGGGAMTRNCIVCLGECGTSWKRMPIDSQDSGEAHWMGHCTLPSERKMQIMRKRAEEER